MANKLYKAALILSANKEMKIPKVAFYKIE